MQVYANSDFQKFEMVRMITDNLAAKFKGTKIQRHRDPTFSQVTTVLTEYIGTNNNIIM